MGSEQLGLELAIPNGGRGGALVVNSQSQATDGPQGPQTLLGSTCPLKPGAQMLKTASFLSHMPFIKFQSNETHDSQKINQDAYCMSHGWPICPFWTKL